MEVHKTASKSRFQRGLTLLALLPAVTGCGPEQQLPEPLGVAKHEVRATSETMTPALRAAYIANVQATASHDYSLKQAGGVLKAHNAAQRFDVEMGEVVSVRLPGDERMSFDLAGVGCEGGLRAVGKARPLATGNRVDYVRRGGEADDLTEWYVHGPLGLEQGFTLDRPLDCGAREVVIDVGLGGSLVPSAAAQGKAVLLRNAVGRAVARYRDLYVVDAAGRELPSKLEVVGRSVRIRFDERGAVFPVRVDPLVAVERQKLIAADAKEGDHFGLPVAISGDTVVVGGEGAAYVFVREGDIWSQQAKLAASDGTPFSPAISVDGDTVVAAAKNLGGTPGAAYVFSRVGGSWIQDAKLEPDDADASISFGSSVAVSADTVVVGADQAGASGKGSGAVYVFVRARGAWTQQAKLLPSDGQGDAQDVYDAGDHMGWSVGVSGDVIIAGAPYYNATKQDAGAVFVFERIGTSWSEVAKWTLSDPLAYNYFGNAVALSNGTAMVGGSGSSDSAYFYTRDRDTWTPGGRIVPLDAGASGVGSALALSKDNLVLGDQAPSESKAYLFSRITDSWVELPNLLPSDGDRGRLFGESVAVFGDTIVVGAPGDDDVADKSGAAYIFVLRNTDGTPCSVAEECASGYCVDGVCCDTACAAGPCDACATTAGASADGTCTPFTGPSCDDGDFCTTTDVCQSGACVGSLPQSCPAVGECYETGVCEPSTAVCEYKLKAEATPCSIGYCSMGECRPEGAGDPTYIVAGSCSCETPGSSNSGAPFHTLWIVAIGLFALRRWV